MTKIPGVDLARDPPLSPKASTGGWVNYIVRVVEGFGSVLKWLSMKELEGVLRLLVVEVLVGL